MKRVKKYVLTGMLLMLLAVLTGCGTREPETGKKISVYYVNTAETKVEVHDQYLNTKTPEEQLEETMTFLSTTPEKLEYKAPFDMGFQVLDYDVVVGPESRGFIFGTPIAYNNHKPFVLIRKKGKLPRETVSATYDLEYGSATIEMHKDSIKPGQKVLIVDDLIATGGTTEAMIKLIESLGGEVAGVVVLIELAGLKGRERINKYRLESAICYEGK